MLDWRGLVGTSLIHGAAIVGWPALDLSVTNCVCWLFVDPAMETVDVLPTQQIALFTELDLPAGLVTVTPTLRDACGSPPGRAPILTSRPITPPHLRKAGSVAFCATIRTDGTISRLVLLRSGGRSADDVWQVRRLIRKARFAPASKPSRIEIALTS